MTPTKAYSLKKPINNAKFFASKPKINVDEDEMMELRGEQYCGYFLEQRAVTKLVVPIDTEIRSAVYYRQVVNKIEELGEGDLVVFRISTPGGDLAGLVELLHAISNTDADTMAEVVGDAYSAGSLLALACDSIVIGKYANFLCHSCSFGSRGKSTDVQRHVQHLSKYAEDIFRECYEHFLTEEEIKDVLEGKELYLNNNEVSERLVRKYQILEELQEAAERGCCGDPEGCDDPMACPCAEDCTED